MPDRKTSVGEPCARSGGYLKGGRGCETRELRIGKIRMAVSLFYAKVILFEDKEVRFYVETESFKRTSFSRNWNFRFEDRNLASQVSETWYIKNNLTFFSTLERWKVFVFTRKLFIMNRRETKLSASVYFHDTPKCLPNILLEHFALTYNSSKFRAIRFKCSILSMLSFSATARGDTARKDGEETQQNRDAHVGQELHNGPDKRHMRNAWGGATVHVSKSLSISSRMYPFIWKLGILPTDSMSIFFIGIYMLYL